MRNKFDEQLLQLNHEMIEMGALCEEVIALASKALTEGDPDMAARVAPLDTEIDQKERTIESLCLKLLLQQQPVARDLRQISAALKMITDMERIGDHSQNIMESAQLKNQDEVKFSPKAVQELESLSNLVRAQMQRSLDMFKAQVTDDTLLGEVEGVEDEIDTTTEALRSHHMDRLKNHKCSAKNGMIYLDMLTNLERIGDHAENIATSAKSATGI